MIPARSRVVVAMARKPRASGDDPLTRRPRARTAGKPRASGDDPDMVPAVNTAPK